MVRTARSTTSWACPPAPGRRPRPGAQPARRRAPPADAQAAPPARSPQPARPRDAVHRARAEIAEVKVAGVSRLLTLTGPGGTGKDAAGAASRRQVPVRLPDGVYFVALASLRDGLHIAGAIAEALGVNGPGRAAAARYLQRVLKDKRALLVLDNFEHLLEAAPLVLKLLTRRRALRRSSRGGKCCTSTASRVLRAAAGAAGPRRAVRFAPDEERGDRCSCSAHRRSTPRSSLRRTTRRPSPRSATGWTGCRWRSSWRRRGSSCSRRGRCSTVWTAAWRCL